MEIRDERPEDIAEIDEVHGQAFGAGHGQVVAELTRALRSRFLPDRGLSLVAQDAGQIIGHVLFTRALLDAPRRLVEVQVLSPVGVLPGYQKQGVGSALIRRGLDILADRGVPLVFLEGSPGYYPRLGFVHGGDLGFRKPSLRIPGPAFQVYRLPAAEPWMSGTLVYPDVFWERYCVGLRDLEI